nr:transforming growth factor-beta-induced protein ig-h3 [Megalopta genalis]
MSCKIFIKILTLSVMCAAICAVRRVPRWNINNTQRQGSNICAVEANDDINYTYYTESKEWNPRQICGKPTSVRYECCAGYYRVAGHPGCTGVKPLLDVIETAKRVGSTKFARLIETSNLAEKLRDGPSVTIFVPSEEAFDTYLRIKGILPEWLLDGNNYVNLIANHIADRRIPSNHWQANLLVPSRLQGNILRLNKFSNGMETVNCHRIVRKDQFATNGVVHVIDGLLDLALAENSDIVDLAAKDGRFGIFLRALEDSELGNRVRYSDVPCTIFAPTDEAFQRIPEQQFNRIMTNPDTLTALIAHHIVAHPVCVPNIISEYRATTILREQELTLSCGPRGPIVDQANLKAEMYHGQNGLLYILDRVLLPDRAKTILDLAKEEGLFTFLAIMKVAGLEESLRSLQHFTMFAPSETAMHSLSEQQLATLRSNQRSARDFVLNHIVTGTYFTNEMSSNQVARTIEVGIPLRLQVYRGAYGIENALIVKADRGCSDGILHVISHVLHPAEESLDYILRREGKFSIWLDALERIKGVQPDIYNNFHHANSSCTYFIPSDDAFRRLGNVKLRTLLEDNNYLTKMVKNHIVDNMMLSESFKPNLQYTVKTKENAVNVMRTNNKILVNDATFVKCDILNKAGVAHEINSVLLPESCSRGYKRTKDGHVKKVCL